MSTRLDLFDSITLELIKAKKSVVVENRILHLIKMCSIALEYVSSYSDGESESLAHSGKIKRSEKYSMLSEYTFQQRLRVDSILNYFEERILSKLR